MSIFENLTLSQKIAEEIALRIAEGKHKQGERLLENELTTLFNTSRAPIREALFMLENEGLVERIPRKGVFVKKYTKKELFDLYDVVYQLTEIALLKAIETKTEEQLNELCLLIKKMESTVKDREIKNCFLLVEDLHLKFFDVSGNTILKEVYVKLNNRWSPFRYMSLSHPISMEKSIKEYSEIVAGLKENDVSRILKSLKKKKERALSILEKIVVDDKH